MTCFVTWLAVATAVVAASSGAMEADKAGAAGAALDREFDVEGFHVRVDLRGQVLAIDAPEDRGFARDRNTRIEAPLLPTLPATGGFVSASVLAQKAKQFDDGLYAAVDEAAQNGAGSFAGKAEMLRRVARALADGGTEGLGEPGLVLYAACKLGGVSVEPRELNAAVQSAVDAFLADELRSKPIGFYTWSQALTAIFRQDRMLQSELKGQAGIAALARAIRSDKHARETYESYLALVSGLTNPLSGHDLRGVLATLDSRGTEVPSRDVAFFPASRAHETDLIKKLYMGRPIPEGFGLVDEMVKRIRSKQIDLSPSASSGWYDYQTWSLETLVAPERAVEAAKLKVGDLYRKQLEELFKGILALTRETHIKQLEVPAPGARAPGDREPVRIDVRPELSAEPLATYYARRAASYRFVRSVIERTFGASALRSMHRLTATGPVKENLAVELDGIEAIFAGASAAVSRELGLPRVVSASPEPASGHSTDGDRQAFTKWAQSLNNDPDVGRDVRMMVPVFFDRGRRKTKVWAFLGWSQRPITIWFATPPAVRVTKNGQPAKPAEVDVQFGGLHSSLAYPVCAEVYVDRILNRNEFRRLCDQFQTRSAILKNLESHP